MKLFNRPIHSLKLNAIALSVGLLSAPIAVFADAEHPNYDNASTVLNLPIVSVDESVWFADVNLTLDFATGRFTILSAEPTDAPGSTATTEPATGDVEEVAEQEPNDSADSAHALLNIGMNSPVSATIGAAEDVDFYTFEVVAGRTYVVELFDVANNLILDGRRSICRSGYTYKGLFPILSDSAGNEISRRCEPNGSGNVHSIFSFTAGISDTYRLRIAAHGDTVLGTYKLRILPKYNEPDASWDAETFEPNNYPAIAYPLEPGSANALSSQIEARSSQYASTYGDQDTYRIEARAGETYSVELFDVANNLILNGERSRCRSGYTYQGLFPIVYDPAINEITRQCEPNGEGNIHTTTSFTAGIDGTYFISVYPHSNTASGTYSIRVIKQ